MNTIIFTVGTVIFVLFLMSDITEYKSEKKSDEDNRGYYKSHQPEEDELD